MDTILISPDGTSWAGSNSGVVRHIYDITWSGSQFVAVGAVGTILTSPDGIGWTSRGSGASSYLHAVTWSGSHFAAVGDEGTIVTSPDGINWTKRDSGTARYLYGITSSGSRLMAVGERGTILQSGPAGPKLRILNAAIGPADGLALVWQTVAGQRYQVQSRTHVAEGPDWTILGQSVTAEGPTVSVELPIEPQQPHRFFRVIAVE